MEKRYSCVEVAEIYGVKIITVQDWIRKKKLPAVRIGKQYVIRQEDLDSFEQDRLTVKRIASIEGDSAQSTNLSSNT